MTSDRSKPDVNADQGTKDSSRREDANRQDKRPGPVGPATSALDEALASGTMEPDPETPSQTPEK